MKTIFKNFLLVALVVPLLTLFCPRAQAMTWYFDTSNEFGAWNGPTPPGYGSVDITKESNGIYFTVTANTTYFLSQNSLIWDKFYFNFNPNKTFDSSKLVVDETGSWSVNYDQNVSMFGVFDSGTTGTGYLGSSNNPLKFHILDTSLNVSDFVYPSTKGYLFAGHLRGFDSIKGNTSTFLAVSTSPTPVPEPGTLVLFGAGLLALALLQKCRAKT